MLPVAVVAVVEPFVAHGQRGIYLPDRTVVESLDGRLVEALDNPRDSLRTVALGDAWSATQVLYFVGYSLWMYFTLPYTFLADEVIMPGLPLKSQDRA